MILVCVLRILILLTTLFAIVLIYIAMFRQIKHHVYQSVMKIIKLLIIKTHVYVKMVIKKYFKLINILVYLKVHVLKISIQQIIHVNAIMVDLQRNGIKHNAFLLLNVDIIYQHQEMVIKVICVFAQKMLNIKMANVYVMMVLYKTIQIKNVYVMMERE